jgi:hypothetical protein
MSGGGCCVVVVVVMAVVAVVVVVVTRQVTDRKSKSKRKLSSLPIIWKLPGTLTLLTALNRQKKEEGGGGGRGVKTHVYPPARGAVRVAPVAARLLLARRDWDGRAVGTELAAVAIARAVARDVRRIAERVSRHVDAVAAVTPPVVTLHTRPLDDLRTLLEMGAVVYRCIGVYVYTRISVRCISVR